MNCYLPFHEKDLPILPLAIASVRKFVQGIDTIYAIGTTDPGCAEFIHEDDVITNLRRDDMPILKYQEHDRTGWYFQQLLKYGVAAREEAEYLAWDADLVAIRPLTLMEGTKPIFSQSSEYHQPYFDTFLKLFGYPVKKQRSFIAEHMVFHAGLMLEMLQEIQRRDVAPWYEAILRHVHGTDISEFADYETYPNWLACRGYSFATREWRAAYTPHYNAKHHEQLAASLAANGIMGITYQNQPGFTPEDSGEMRVRFNWSAP